MNVWILSVRELARLLRGRLTWLAAALTVLSPLAGLTVYRSASADTMQSLYVANPALAGGVLGGLFFALLTLCDCARTSRCRVEVLCDAAVSPLTAALARLMALLGTAALTLALTLLTWLPWTAHTVGAVFDGGDYLLAYLILMGLALPLCILLAGAAWQFTRRFDLSLVLVAALAALSLTIWRDNWQLCWLNPCVWALSDDFSNFRILRSAAYMRLTWLAGLAGVLDAVVSLYPSVREGGVGLVSPEHPAGLPSGDRRDIAGLFRHCLCGPAHGGQQQSRSDGDDLF